MYTAVRGGGAMLTAVAVLRVSDAGFARASMIGCRFCIYDRAVRYAVSVSALFALVFCSFVFSLAPTSNGIRRFGTALLDLCMVGLAGNLEMRFSNIKPSVRLGTVAAARLFITEAGGQITRRPVAEPLPIGSSAVVRPATDTWHERDHQQSTRPHCA